MDHMIFLYPSCEHKNKKKKLYPIQNIAFSLFYFITGNLWTIELALPADVSIPFRYFIASTDPCSQNEAVHVRRWESHLEPRVIPSGMDLQTNPDYDTFGTVKWVEKIDKGWLTNETILQFKFFSNPFALKERIKNRLLYVKVSKLHITNAYNTT